MGEHIELEEGQTYIFGREPASDGAQLVLLDSKSVSRNHCKITVSRGSALLEDLQSSNGTRVNRQKVQSVHIYAKDLVQMGEFTFVVEGDSESTQNQKTNNQRTNNQKIQNTEAASTEPKLKIRIPSFVQTQVEKFNRLDLSKRWLIILMLGGMLGHWLTTAPALSDARKYLLVQSFDIARKGVRSLGEKNKRELAEGSSFLLDCKSNQGVSGVLESYLLDSRGKAVCPVGADVPMDELSQYALFRGEQADNCEWRINYKGFEDCEFVYPVREFQEKQSQYVTVGVARIRYSPQDAFEAVQRLQTQSWKTLVVSLLFLLGVWWLSRRWLDKSLLQVSEGLHLVVTGNAPNLEKLETFAAGDVLVDEVNRLISKSNQAVKSKNEGSTEEASFLQLLIQQVLLLEERAVMVVDKDNHLIAASASLSAVVPVNVEQINAHITDAVSESHLQGELMTLLNDLSTSSEVIDRALSSSDRIVQVRAMPLFLADDYVAAILIF